MKAWKPTNDNEELGMKVQFIERETVSRVIHYTADYGLTPFPIHITEYLILLS